MTGNRVFYFRVHDGGHSARKRLHDNGDEFQSELFSVSLSRLMSSQLHYMQEYQDTGYVFVPFFVTVCTDIVY